MGDVWRHWLVPVSCVFYHGLYFLLRRFIVRGVCDPILRKQCRHHGSMDAGSRRLANGFTAKPPSPGLGNGVDVKGVSGSACAQRSKLSDGEVADIAAKVVSTVSAIFIASEGLSTMWQTADDIMHSKSSTLPFLTHFFVWYFVADLFFMYNTTYLKRNLAQEGRVWRRLWIFAKAKAPFLAHHGILIVVGYPIGVDRSWRKQQGDFLVGTFFIREISTPFLMFAQIMKTVNLHHTALATATGVLTILTFFVCRIMNTPLTILFYAAQHHNWDLLAAAGALKPLCHVTLALELLLQVYWFAAILRIAAKTVMGSKASKQH